MSRAELEHPLVALTVSNTTAALRYLRICDDAIEQCLLLIADIGFSNMAPDRKRRALFKAQSRLGDIQCAAERVRIATGVA